MKIYFTSKKRNLFACLHFFSPCLPFLMFLQRQTKIILHTNQYLTKYKKVYVNMVLMEDTNLVVEVNMEAMMVTTAVMKRCYGYYSRVVEELVMVLMA